MVATNQDDFGNSTRNLARSGPRRPADPKTTAAPRTEVSGMQTFWGLLSAYWKSDQRRVAWVMTIIIAGITWFVAKVGIWIAESAGAFENAKATYQTPGNLDPFHRFYTAGIMLVAMISLNVVSVATRHFFSQTLHRRWRMWLNQQFTDATLNDKHVILNIQSNAHLDSVDQRQQECLKNLAGNSIGLAMGVLTVVASTWEVSSKLWSISTPVKGAAAFGDYASFAITLGLIVPFAFACTWGFSKLGNLMREVNKTFQEAEGAYRGELNTMFRRASQITASAGERVQKKINRNLYSDIDHVWHRNNVLQAGFTGLQDFYSTMSFQILASVLALPAYAQGAISFQTYITTAALVGQLTNGFSWLINVTPAMASLKADVERVNEYAVEIERVQDAKSYFRETGIHDFTYYTHEAKKGIVVSGLELMHEGHSSKPFLIAERKELHFPAGSWTALVGNSGSGKTSLLNALMGQNDYGRAVVFLPDGEKPFYACQDLRISHTSLKQLVAGSEDEDDYADADIAAVLSETGLGFPDFLRNMNEKTCNGRPWERALSGGQKKRLFLARLFLHKPEVALLDEVTAGLDPHSQQAFYTLLKQHLPRTTVISSIHNRAMPYFANGKPVYDHVAEIDAGVLRLRAFRSDSALHKADAQGAYSSNV